MDDKNVASTPALHSTTADIDRNSTGYFGCVEELQPRIAGWTLNAGREDEPITVDVLVDGQRVATTYCVKPRVDITAKTNRPNRAGFAIDPTSLKLPPAVTRRPDDDTVELEFRIRGSDWAIAPLFSPVMTVAALRELASGGRGRDASTSDIRRAIEPLVREVEPPAAPPEAEDVQVIAFYLPQYHPIPENDRWWGPGFTEWTNVAQGKPQFAGHYQPRVPGELGYYDLRLPEVREAQARLAREHGVAGFCYYYYWFNGRRILERPLQEVLDSGSPDFPFCICWANETWSRRWDGSEDEVLLKQEHSPTSDVEFIRDVLPILKDPRYIRVHGAPLLMVYRASLFPDLRATADIWRRVCAEEGIPDIHLCIVESFGFDDPHSVGFDSSVQFPPHNIQPTDITGEVEGVDEDFAGRIYDYAEVVQAQVSERQPDYRRFRGVMCSWDNTARRKNRGFIFNNATPELYEVWLRNAVDWTRRHRAPGERLVFVNAWNEWAEGTHLEPDAKHGRAYLEATRRVVDGRTSMDALLDYARRTETLAGDELRTWLAEVEARVGEAQAVRAYAEKIVKRSHMLIDAGTIASTVEPYILRALPLVNVGRAYIDRLNGLPHQIKTAAVRRTDPLYLEGWCVHPGAQCGPLTISYAVFENAATKQRYYAPIYGRLPRKDVADSLPELPNSHTLYCGLKAFVDLCDVEPGEYRLGILQAAPDSVSLNFGEGAIRVA